MADELSTLVEAIVATAEEEGRMFTIRSPFYPEFDYEDFYWPVKVQFPSIGARVLIAISDRVPRPVLSAEILSDSPILWYRVSRLQAENFLGSLFDHLGATIEEIEAARPSWSDESRAFFIIFRGKEFIIHATTDWEGLLSDLITSSEEDHG